MAEKDLKQFITVYLKGFAMGCADAVPGVSGGTVALILGIYEKMVDSITNLTSQKIGVLLTDAKKFDQESLIENIRDLGIVFLTVLSLGIITAVITTLRFVNYMVSYYPTTTYGFFTGLIASSSVLMISNIDLKSFKTGFTVLTGFLISFTVSGLAANTLGNGIPVLFLSGMLAVSAMILPGISGALILLILGQYSYMAEKLTEFTQAVYQSAASASLKPLLETSTPIIVFISGGIIGLTVFSHLIRKALENHRKTTLAFLVSLVLGSIRAPVAQLNNRLIEQQTSWLQILPEFTLATALGIASIILLDHKTGVMKY